MQPIIQARDFSFRYMALAEDSLRELNFSIYPGEKVLITGASGSGKSTLSYCLNGLIPNAYEGKLRGELLIAGQQTSGRSIFDASSVISTILQDQDSQFIGLSVGEDVAFMMENLQASQDAMRQQVRRALALVNMQQLSEMSPGALSGGQKQSVSLAGVLTSDAEVLLFDEPLANLDPYTGQQAMALIAEIHASQGKTCMIIEHRIEEVLLHAFDRLIVFEQGRIIANDHPDQLLAAGILEQAGLRVPHHVKLLKYAGCRLRAEEEPSSLETFNCQPHRQAIIDWLAMQSAPVDIVNQNTELLRLQDVGFAYQQGKPQLQRINFSLYQGEMVCLLGANGAGKSTLSNLICGMLPMQQGQIWLDGESINPWSIMQRGRSIGYVMQNPNLMLTQQLVCDEVAFGLKVQGLSPDIIEQRVNSVLKTCGLYGHRNWPLAKLSYGQKKRISIAAILALQPKVLILDEPTAGQDYQHYCEFMHFIRQIAKSGIAILFITHDMHLALEYCQRALVLCDGHIIADDKPSQVLTDRRVVKRARLKQHSLVRLAERLQLANGSDFVECFIDYERRACHEPQ